MRLTLRSSLSPLNGKTEELESYQKVIKNYRERYVGPQKFKKVIGNVMSARENCQHVIKSYRERYVGTLAHGDLRSRASCPRQRVTVGNCGIAAKHMPPVRRAL